MQKDNFTSDAKVDFVGVGVIEEGLVKGENLDGRAGCHFSKSRGHGQCRTKDIARMPTPSLSVITTVSRLYEYD